MAVARQIFLTHGAFSNPSEELLLKTEFPARVLRGVIIDVSTFWAKLLRVTLGVFMLYRCIHTVSMCTQHIAHAHLHILAHLHMKFDKNWSMCINVHYPLYKFIEKMFLVSKWTELRRIFDIWKIYFVFPIIVSGISIKLKTGKPPILNFGPKNGKLNCFLEKRHQNSMHMAENHIKKHAHGPNLTKNDTH